MARTPKPKADPGTLAASHPPGTAAPPAGVPTTDPDQREARVGHELQGTAYDPGATGHELQGRDRLPEHIRFEGGVLTADRFTSDEIATLAARVLSGQHVATPEEVLRLAATALSQARGDEGAAPVAPTDLAAPAADPAATGLLPANEPIVGPNIDSMQGQPPAPLNPGIARGIARANRFRDIHIRIRGGLAEVRGEGIVYYRGQLWA